MKNRILSTILLSGIALNSVSNITLVSANDIDSKIKAKETTINNLTSAQANAKAQVEAVQSQVSDLQSEQAKLDEETKRLEAESENYIADIKVLSSKMIARKESLAEQARSAQQNGGATKFINVLLSSKSISDFASRAAAMNDVVSANESMLEQQEADKNALEEKQKANQSAINTVWENQKSLAANAVSLKTREAELQVAQLNLKAELTTVESEKAALLAEKAEAERAAAAAAAAEKAAREKAAAEAAAQAEAEKAAREKAAVEAAAQATAPTTDASAQPIVQTPVTTVVQATPVAPQPVVEPTTTTAPAVQQAAPVKNRPTYSSNASSYPVGECTWGVKTLAPWVGDYWGNGGQWLASAAAAGFATGSTPAVGAVAVWTGGYGHVALVTEVNGSQIRVQESNFNGNRYISDFRGWFNPAASGVAGYIYP